MHMNEGTTWILHSRPHLPHEWWACEYPERPLDDNADCDLFCSRCFAAAEASVARNPGGLTLKYEPQNPCGIVCLFADVLKGHVERHGKPLPL